MLGLGQLSIDLAPIRSRESANRNRGVIVAKRKKAGKVQKRGKLLRGNSAKRGKSRRAFKAAKATKRTVAKPKPKRAPVKKAARRMKQPVTPAVETVAVEVIEQPAPGVITVTEVEETPGSGLQRALKRMNPNR
jgi:hypothetical protein